MKLRSFLGLCFLMCLPILGLANSESLTPLLPYHADLHDQASLQRGAKMFMNYCSGCHSLKYMRYNGIARDIGITGDNGEVLVDLIKDNLIFTGAKITDPIVSAMTPEMGKKFFGVAPPDLTLEARVRGVSWLYTYFRTFYQDPKRPWGTNNLVFVDVGMPNVLLPLQGTQIPQYRTVKAPPGSQVSEIQVFDQFKTPHDGSMSPQEFDQAVRDLVNFLAFVSEPMKNQQRHIGMWVLIFLGVMIILTYLLKREFWKDIH